MANPTSIVVEDSQARPTVKLDGLQAHVHVGYTDKAGSLTITSPAGKDVIYLSGQNASLTLGGESYRGILTILDANQKPVIYFDSANGDFILGNAGFHGSIRLKGAANDDRIVIDGTAAEVIAGGANKSGLVAVNTGAGLNSISLNGADGTARFIDTAAGYQIQIIPTQKKILIGSTQIPDFVFEDAYPLMPLRDVEKYIKSNRKLPDMPSSTQTEEQGLDLIGLSVLMLQKIEELTLHVIQLNRRIETLESNSMSPRSPDNSHAVINSK